MGEDEDKNLDKRVTIIEQQNIDHERRLTRVESKARTLYNKYITLSEKLHTLLGKGETPKPEPNNNINKYLIYILAVAMVIIVILLVYLGEGNINDAKDVLP